MEHRLAAVKKRTVFFFFSTERSIRAKTKHKIKTHTLSSVFTVTVSDSQRKLQFNQRKNAMNENYLRQRNTNAERKKRVKKEEKNIF